MCAFYTDVSALQHIYFLCRMRYVLIFVKEGCYFDLGTSFSYLERCIEEGWEAYRHNSLPHGAVITDAEDRIVARGRNRIREQGDAGRQVTGNRLAHAELNALMELDWRAVNVYTCKLYSLIEPCAMCIGAVRMAHMQTVSYAVRDGGAGGTTLIDKTPFFQDGHIQVTGPQDNDEWAQFIEDIYTWGNQRWHYLIPEQPAERQRLRTLCQQALAFEQHYLQHYHRYLQ